MTETAADSYLSRQLIAYIGNKRRLLPFLSDAFRALEERTTIRTFLDPFCGSGAVSRLAKTLDYAVSANDWEDYAWVVTSAHLLVNPSDLRQLFGGSGGIASVTAELNEIGAAARHEEDRPGYLADNYAPRRTEEADYRRERLFYTVENARFLDAVRDRIEEWYPGWELPPRSLREKLLLVSSVVYEAATHANTSGVFKACHKGFGGFGKDALKRILSSVRLEVPLVRESTVSMTVDCQDATSFVASRSADLCYLDPPYTTHQYGSNYHLLNSIVRWDKPPVDSAFGKDGRLRAKAGIRPDWTATRSDFCVRSKAKDALERVLDATDCRYVALSYNTEGIVPVEQVYEIMAKMGRTELMGTDYVLYRGGKQSMFRNTHNLEYLLVLRKGSSAQPGDYARVRRFLAAKRMFQLLKEAFVPERIRDEFDTSGARVILERPNPAGGTATSLRMRHFHLFETAADQTALEQLSSGRLEAIILRLERARCRDRREEAEVLLGILSQRSLQIDGRELLFLQGRLAAVLKKFAHRKYRELFEESREQIMALVDSDPLRFELLGERIAEVERIARLRFSG